MALSDFSHKTLNGIILILYNQMKTVSVCLLLMLSIASAWAQCPMCKASVESAQSTGAKSVGMGLNVGILILLASVYVILFSVGILWYKKYRRSQVNEQ
jgi:heme/copper-type cytochrome/quinol oxidase subunit 2